MTNTQEQPDFDLDEDLFDFAQATRESDGVDPEEDLDEIFASFRDASLEEELLDLPAAPSSRPDPVRSPAAAEVVPVAEVRARPAAAAQAKPGTLAHTAPPAAELVPAPRAPLLSRGVLAIALAVTVLNSALAVVMLGRRDGGNDVRAVANDQEQPTEHSEAPLAASSRLPETRLPDPDGLSVIHAHPTLDEARAQISRGEYAAARQRVYGLLSIIDRLDEPRRSALEADCRFLIAQSLHLEALARMGGTQ